MAKQPPSQGTCYLCKGIFSKTAMTRHLTKCLTTHDDAAKVGAGKAERGKLVRVVVEGKYDPCYWLHVEMPAKTKLGFLDEFLRNIWLECCGHLSEFRIEGKKRPAGSRSVASLLAARRPMAEVFDLMRSLEEPDDVDMDSQVGDVFEKGTKVAYDYDFGSTTKLSLKGVGTREGIIVKPDEVRLLARNEPPNITCGRCHNAEATAIDMDNSYDRSGWLCAKCAKETGLAGSDRTLPVVNSPRTGVCGYTGD